MVIKLNRIVLPSCTVINIWKFWWFKGAFGVFVLAKEMDSSQAAGILWLILIAYLLLKCEEYSRITLHCSPVTPFLNENSTSFYDMYTACLEFCTVEEKWHTVKTLHLTNVPFTTYKTWTYEHAMEKLNLNKKVLDIK